MEANTKAVLDYVTLGIAVFGALLGVINTAIQWRQHRPRLRVVPLVARVNGASLRLCVRVTNVGVQPVVVDHVALRLRGGLRLGFRPERLPMEQGIRTLAPRASVTLFLPDGAREHQHFGRVHAVEVGTECGLIKQASNRALRWFVVHRPAATQADEIEQLGNTWGCLVTSPDGPPKSTLEPLNH
jgi:hypothetical protein